MSSVARVVVAFALVGCASHGAQAGDDTACRAGSRPMARAELYFGAAAVGEKAWRRFLATVITPLFPDGLTTVVGMGQWKGQSGLVRERTRLLIVFYAPDAASDTRIETIRDRYKLTFHQTSVLRVDSNACVGF